MPPLSTSCCPLTHPHTPHTRNILHTHTQHTEECIRLLQELDAPVEYIVLPTFAYEHKVFVGPFSRRFPKAKVGSGAKHGNIRIS